MIPKIIHYCWFGGNELSEMTLHCIDSWKKYCPNYEIKLWNEDNFDIHCCSYVEEAYKAQKWAFVADYVRFKVLYEEGGLYFDTDIEVLKSFDELLCHNAFFGFGKTGLTLPVFGAMKGEKCLLDCLNYYKSCQFVKEDGKFNTVTIEHIAEKILTDKYGLKMNGKFQILIDDIVVYPKEYFFSTDWKTGKITRNPKLFVIHYVEGSWLNNDEKEQQKIIRKCVKIFGEKIGINIGMGIFFLKQEGICSTFAHGKRFLKRKLIPIYMKIVGLYNNKNKVVMCNFDGKGFGDNPKYIALELLERRKDIDIVWISKDGDSSEFPNGIRLVKKGSWKEYFELATARIWIDNNRKETIIRKNKKQKYIQTWHGSYILKKIERDADKELDTLYVENAKHDSLMIDVLLSNCPERTKLFKRAFWYEGPIKEIGSPRNDIFFMENNCRSKICKKFRISPEKKIVLYAPTFRDNHSVLVYNINFDMLLENLRKKFGGEWVCLLRLHPAIREKSEQIISKYNELIDASYYGDIQELFVASDVLISDYSDCMFEFSFTRRPVFLFVPDLEQYKQGRSFYYDIYDLPYEIAEDNEELMKRIINFDSCSYNISLESFLNKVGFFDDGQASRKVVDMIDEWVK